MIAVFDLAGNSYPIAADGLFTGKDIYNQLHSRYGLQDFELFAKQAALDPVGPVDPSILSGDALVVVVFLHEMGGPSNSFIRPDDQEEFSIHRFSHLCFSSSSPPGHRSDSDS
jgi:hypothetical protein